MKANSKWGERISTIIQPLFQLDLNLCSTIHKLIPTTNSAARRILMIVNIYYNCRLITGKMFIDFFSNSFIADSLVSFLLLIFIFILSLALLWTSI